MVAAMHGGCRGAGGAEQMGETSTPIVSWLSFEIRVPRFLVIS